MIKQYKLPTLLALFLLVIGIAAGVFLVQSDKIFQSQATPEITPQQVRITNVSDKSFTVSWITDGATDSFISYGVSASLGSVSNQKTTKKQIHHIQVTELSAATTYYFKLSSDTKLFDNNGNVYQIKTAPLINLPAPSPVIIFGNIVASGKPVSEALVYVNLLGVTSLSTVTDTSGRWSIPISTSRSTTLTSYAAFNTNSTAEIFVQAGTLGVATAKVKVNAASPVPAISIGENHDFTNLKVLPSEGLPTSQINIPTDTSAPASKFSVDESSGTAKVKVTLSSIRDQEQVNTLKPSFVGTGTPKTQITITLQSPTTYTAKVTVDANGNWSWTPPSSLETGAHTLTLSWVDENGQTQTLKRTFTVMVTGTSSLPSFTATPSGSPAIASPTPTPTLTPTPTPKPATGSAETTSSGRIALPATTSAEIAAGSLTPSIAIFIMGIVLVLLGLFFPKFKT